MTTDEHKVNDMKEAIQFICLASQEVLEKIYGKGATAASVAENFSNDEIISKYKEYRASVTGSFVIGDEIRRETDTSCSDPRVVTAVYHDPQGNEWITIMTKHGKFYGLPADVFIKTGKHYPQIQEVLDALNGEDGVTQKDEAAVEARGGPVKLGLYRHFKGGIYKVIANGFMEKDNTPIVVYENPKTGKVWVRSLLDFNTMVQNRGLDGPGDLVPRFTYLGGRK